MPVHYTYPGRVAVVTGGAKGLGRRIAERLRDGGARVFVWDLEPPAYDGVGFCRVDVTRTEDVQAGVEHVMREAGRIDILVNNAGITGGTRNLEDTPPDAWRHIIEVNLHGTYECSRLVVPHMRRAGWGRIVNMASLAGKDGSPGIAAYATAKAGVIALTKALGKELALTDIRVNCVAPAAADTDILRQMDPAAVQSMIDRSPQKRLGTADEVAEVILWLCSEACSFNTGAVFDVSGGRAVY